MPERDLLAQGLLRAPAWGFLSADEYPEARSGSQPSKVQPFAAYLQKRWLAGCHNARQLYREIKAQGYRGHVKVLQADLGPWRKLLPEQIRRLHGVPAMRPPAPRTAAWWLLPDEDKLKDEEGAFAAEVTSRGPEIKMAHLLAREFQRLLRGGGEVEVDAWFKAVEESGVVEFRNFAN